MKVCLHQSYKAYISFWRIFIDSKMNSINFHLVTLTIWLSNLSNQKQNKVNKQRHESSSFWVSDFNLDARYYVKIDRRTDRQTDGKAVKCEFSSRSSMPRSVRRVAIRCCWEKRRSCHSGAICAIFGLLVTTETLTCENVCTWAKSEHIKWKHGEILPICRLRHFDFHWTR